MMYLDAYLKMPIIQYAKNYCLLKMKTLSIHFKKKNDENNVIKI